MNGCECGKKRKRKKESKIKVGEDGKVKKFLFSFCIAAGMVAQKKKRFGEERGAASPSLPSQITHPPSPPLQSGIKRQ